MRRAALLHVMPLSKRDRSLLRGLVAAMILGVGGSLGLAASCFGRDTAHRASDPGSEFPEDQSAPTSGGGVPGEEVEEVGGTTQVTAAELPPAGAAAATTNAVPTAAPSAEVPAPHTPTIETTPRPAAGVTPPAASAPSTESTQSESAADAGAPRPETPAPAGPVDAGAPGPATFRNPLQPTPFSPDIGAGGFTEPPMFGASSWVPNHEAGAGPFTTERNVPDQPGP